MHDERGYLVVYAVLHYSHSVLLIGDSDGRTVLHCADDGAPPPITDRSMYKVNAGRSKTLCTCGQSKERACATQKHGTTGPSACVTLPV